MRLSQIVQAKKRFPDIKREKAQGNLEWVCCSDPFRGRTEKGEQVWMSWCMWRRGNDEHGGMNRVVGRPKVDPQTGNRQLGRKPTKIMLDGKTVPKCPR